MTRGADSAPRTVPADFDPLDAARRFFAARGGAGDVWLVGGRVRDALLGRASLDTDLAVRNDALKIAAELARETGGSFVALDPIRDIARVVWSLDVPPSNVQLSDAQRSDAPPRNASRGDTPLHTGRSGLDARERSLDIKSLEGGDLSVDLASRDLTINALALPLSGVHAGAEPIARDSVIDQHGGLGDLDARRVRMLAPSAFDADPLRLLRAPRIALDLGFDIEPATRAAIRQRARRAAEPAAERVRDEVLRLLAASDPAAAIRSLDSLGLLPAVLPELARISDRPFRDRLGPRAFEVCLVAIDTIRSIESIEAIEAAHSIDAGPSVERAAPWTGIERAVLAGHIDRLAFEGRPTSLWLRLATIMAVAARSAGARYDHRRGRWSGEERPAALRRSALDAAARLRLSASAADWLAAVVAHAGAPERIGRSGLDPVAMARAVHRLERVSGGRGADVALVACALNGAASADVIGALIRHGMEREAAADAVLIDGRGLIEALGIPPGPLVGRLLEAIGAERAAGTIRDRDSALAFARTLSLADRAVG